MECYLPDIKKGKIRLCIYVFCADVHTYVHVQKCTHPQGVKTNTDIIGMRARLWEYF